MMMLMENEKEKIKVKLNKETLEAKFTQIDYLKGVKKDQMTFLIKSFDGKLTEDAVDEIYKLFKSLDTEEKNEMPVTQLGTTLRILQQMPTDNEVQLLIDTINPKKPTSESPDKEKKPEKKPEKKADKKPAGKGGKGGKGGAEGEEEEKINFFQFMHALALYMRDPNEIADEIKQAFRVLDRSKQGYIMVADLRDFLSKLGDCLTDEEIDAMVKIGDTGGDGKIYYEQFVDLMVEMKPGKKKKGKKGKKGKKKK